MSVWVECVYCKGRGSVPIEWNERRIYTSSTYIERITGYKTCPHCDGEGKVLIQED